MRKQKYRLASRLYYISAGLFVLFSINLIITIGFDIFQKKPMEHWTFFPSHVTGYTMAVNMQVRTFDSLVKFERYEGGERRSYGSILLENGTSPGSDRRDLDTILKNPSYKKDIIRQTKEVRSDSDFDVNIGAIDLTGIPAKGYVLIRPTNAWLTMLLASRNYATYAIAWIVLFLLMRLFRKLKDGISFDGSLSRAIWLMGNGLLLYQLFLFVTGILVCEFVENIAYSEEINGFGGKEVMNLSISYDVNMVMVFTGLALVVLSKLLDHGNELQQETDLTV